MSMGLDSLLLLRKKGTYYYTYLIPLTSPLKYSLTLSTSLTCTLLLDRYHASPVIFNTHFMHIKSNCLSVFIT